MKGLKNHYKPNESRDKGIGEQHKSENDLS